MEEGMSIKANKNLLKCKRKTSLIGEIKINHLIVTLLLSGQ